MGDGADEPVGVTGVNPDGHLAAWTLCRLNWSCLCHFEGLTMCRSPITWPNHRVNLAQ